MIGHRDKTIGDRIWNDANGDGIQDVFIGALDTRELILLLGDGRGGLTVSTRVGAGGSR